jgi:hypothetical protein
LRAVPVLPSPDGWVIGGKAADDGTSIRHRTAGLGVTTGFTTQEKVILA